jgi:hypothetical protein
MGYAIIMVRSGAGFGDVDLRRLLRALWPFLGAQLLVILLVFKVPALVHLLDAVTLAGADAPASEQDIVRQMEEMSRASSADDATAPALDASAPKPPAKTD